MTDTKKSPLQFLFDLLGAKTLSNNLAKPQQGCAGWLISRIVFEKKNVSLVNDVLAKSDIRAGHTVLDIGHGPGLGIVGALDRGASMVYGVELSKYMIKKARRAVKKKPSGSQVEFLCGDICAGAPEIPTGSVDRVMVVNCVYFWTSVPEGCRTLARVCRSGAKVVFGVRFGFLQNREELDKSLFVNIHFEPIRAELERAGFINIVYVPAAADTYFGDETIVATRL